MSAQSSDVEEAGPAETSEEVTAAGAEKTEGGKSGGGSRPVRRRTGAAALGPSNWAHRRRSAPDRLSVLRSLVEKAVAEHKIFSMVGAFPSVREALRQRGWLEKRSPGSRSSKKKKTASQQPHTDVPDHGSAPTDGCGYSKEESDEVLISRLLRQSSVDLYWTMRDSIEWSSLTKNQIVNRFPRAYFTSKIGLCSSMQQVHWYCEVGVSEILFPRCYTISHGDELTAFKYDFQITACLSLLKWLVATYEEGGEQAVQSVEGRIPTAVVEFALSRCNEYVSKQTHEDIDQDDYITVWEHQWDQFLTCYYKVIHENHQLHEHDDNTIQETCTRARDTLSRVQKFWPQLDLDGVLNIWIVKPGNKSRGRGIKLMNKLEDILARVNPNISKESRYVVQKYIERPLLIHNTKFDIRQWFLITCADPLTVWMYKESYLRFCSQSFSLKNMHESIHLCNNSVQTRYKNGRRDSPDLPDENMWDCYTFKTYLRTIGHADMWESRVYPGMKEGIIGALLASQEHMDRRNNCFELFGADFMLTEDFNPWLIEINSCPDMSPSTSVTARMCAQCLEDVVKVVIDRRQNKRACTGMFELAYKQHIPPAPPYLGMSLALRGKKIPKESRARKKSSREDSEDRSSVSSQSEVKGEYPTGVPTDGEETSGGEEGSRARTRASERDRPRAVAKRTKRGLKRTLRGHKRPKERKASQSSGEFKNEETQVEAPEEKFSGPSSTEHPPAPQEQEPSGEPTEAPNRTWLNPTDEEASGSPEGDTQLNLDQVLSRPDTSETDPQDYKQSLDKTKANCIELLAKLKLFRENDQLVGRPRYFPLGRDKETGGNKPTMREIINKLAQYQPEKDFLVCPRGKGFMKRFSGIPFSTGRAERLPGPSEAECLPNRPERANRTASSHRTRNARPGLPANRTRFKPSGDPQDDRDLDNLLAIGMSLKSLQHEGNREDLLLPLGAMDAHTANTLPAKLL